MASNFRIVHSTWVRFHHIDLARELHRLGCLERIFTCLPWWRAAKESREQGIPRDLISCNFLIHGIRRVAAKVPGHSRALDLKMAILETDRYSRWVARRLPSCDAYIGLSGTGRHAGRVAQERGAGYVMDRGSTQVRWGEAEDRREAERWGMPFEPVPEWLVRNEEAEQELANLITVPSNFAAGTFVAMGTDPRKIRIVPYGVPLEEFSPQGRPPQDEFRLVFVGRIGMRKGIGYLLEAFRRFQHPRKRLILVGSVDPAVRPILEAAGLGRVEFAGVVPRREVARYVSQSHALVLPSIHEGLALVLAQAMACGCPIIASTATGAEDLATHGLHGLIVPPRDTDALVAAFTALADDPGLRDRMGAACLERVRTIGGWQLYAEGMVRVAREAKQLVAARGGSR